MGRQPRHTAQNCCYHITVRCNSREFRLVNLNCREFLLYALAKCRDKYGFKLYGLCIMSNHVHYLFEPKEPQDLPKIMHWLNWYTAMGFNRMLNRSGHFWEKRYHSSAFASSDQRRALNTLRYIHANPKAAGMQQGFFYDYSNYGSYDRLTDDGLCQWHPAFMALGATLEICAEAYRRFCQNYKPKAKPAKQNYWGTRLLKQLNIAVGQRRKKHKRKVSRGQLSLWDGEDEESSEIKAIAEKFVLANCFDPVSKAQKYRKKTNRIVKKTTLTVPGNESPEP